MRQRIGWSTATRYKITELQKILDVVNVNGGNIMWCSCRFHCQPRIFPFIDAGLLHSGAGIPFLIRHFLSYPFLQRLNLPFYECRPPGIFKTSRDYCQREGKASFRLCQVRADGDCGGNLPCRCKCISPASDLPMVSRFLCVALK